VAEADVEACKAAPTSQCLADIGLAIAMAQEKLSTKKGAAEMLAQMGRFEEADALTFHIYRVNGWSEEAARLEADHQMATYRVQQALLAGQSYEVATKGASGETIQAAYRQIARLQFQHPSITFETTRDPHRLALIEDYANRSDLTKQQKVAAANMLQRVGEAEAAKHLFLSIIDEPGDPPFVPYGMIKLIGTQTALEVFQSRGDLHFCTFKRLSRAESDRDRAEIFLRSAFDIAKLEHRKTASPNMMDVIVLAAELKHMEFAKRATKDFEAVMQDANTSTADDKMMLVRCLIAIQAPTPLIRAHLDAIRNSLSDRSASDPHGLLGQGVGRRYAQIGDVEAAATAIAASNDAIRSWQLALRSDLPPGVFDALYKIAHETLTRPDLAVLKGKVALSLSLAKRSAAEHEIARKAAWDILDQPPQSDANAHIWFYTFLLMAAHRLEDTALTEAVRPDLATYALETRAYLPLLQAAHLTYQIEQTNTR
ncbi:MAG: hypothetical protein ABJC64_18845, partial [Paracoccaceae bacterium]